MLFDWSCATARQLEYRVNISDNRTSQFLKFPELKVAVLIIRVLT